MKTSRWIQQVVSITGAYYMFTVDAFNRMGFVPCGRVGYVVDDEADDIVDIDTPHDFARAEILIQSHVENLGIENMLNSCDVLINNHA